MLYHNQNVYFHVIPAQMECFQFSEWKSIIPLRYFILILNHTNIPTRIIWKWNGISGFRHNLDDSSLESWMWQSPKTGTAMKHKDGAVYLDVPAPANGRRYIPRSPTRGFTSLIATPEEDDVTSSSSSGFLWSCYTSEVISPYKRQWQKEKSSSGFYLVVWPWARYKTLVRTKWLNSHMKKIDLKIWSLPGIMIVWPQAES